MKKDNACSVVLVGEYGALLRYPTRLGVTLVEERYGYTKSTDSPKRIRAKKRRNVNAGEEYQSDYYSQVKERLLVCYSRIFEAASTIHYFPVQQPCSSSCTVSDVDFASLCSLAIIASTTDSPEQPVILSDSEGQECTDVFGKMISNVSDHDLNISVMAKQFIIPPRSAFLLCDLSQITPLYEYASEDIYVLTLPGALLEGHSKAGQALLQTSTGHYDLIVVDPPWENHSTIRGKKYMWLPKERLLDVSLPRLAARGALVAVWVTNNRKFAMFVRHTLFPKWQVQYLTEWHWLKVTTAGDLIHDIDSVHKKPYEVAVIGEYLGSQNGEVDLISVTHSSRKNDSMPPLKQPCLGTGLMATNTTPETISSFRYCSKSHNEVSGSIQHSACNGSNNSAAIARSQSLFGKGCITTACLTKELGDRYVCTENDTHEHHLKVFKPFVFTCVASRTHSQKPYLGDILTKHYNKDGRKLELFARNLVPGWTSWGNEVLKFQEQVKVPLTS